MARKEELGRLLSSEEGKTLPEGIGETIRAAQVFDFFAGEALRLTGETVSAADAEVETSLPVRLLLGRRVDGVVPVHLEQALGRGAAEREQPLVRAHERDVGGGVDRLDAFAGAQRNGGRRQRQTG